jgi:hypothetical protein
MTSSPPLNSFGCGTDRELFRKITSETCRLAASGQAASAAWSQ